VYLPALTMFSNPSNRRPTFSTRFADWAKRKLVGDPIGFERGGIELGGVAKIALNVLITQSPW